MSRLLALILGSINTLLVGGGLSGLTVRRGAKLRSHLTRSRNCLPRLGRSAKIHAIALTVIFAMFAAPTPAAAIAYYYTGAKFTEIVNGDNPDVVYTTDMAITGHFYIAEVLASDFVGSITDVVLNFAFDDGVNTFVCVEGMQPLCNLDYWFIWVSTNASGEITEWNIGLGTKEYTPSRWDTFTRNYQNIAWDRTTHSGSRLINSSFEDARAESFTPGTWSLIPEPSTALLLDVGLVWMTVGRRRRGQAIISSLAILCFTQQAIAFTEVGEAPPFAPGHAMMGSGNLSQLLGTLSSPSTKNSESLGVSRMLARRAGDDRVHNTNRTQPPESGEPPLEDR